MLSYLFRLLDLNAPIFSSSGSFRCSLFGILVPLDFFLLEHIMSWIEDTSVKVLETSRCVLLSNFRNNSA